MKIEVIDEKKNRKREKARRGRRRNKEEKEKRKTSSKMADFKKHVGIKSSMSLHKSRLYFHRQQSETESR